jgi:prepilin-type N-terminal cleavage/methylation domain-containing protein
MVTRQPNADTGYTIIEILAVLAMAAILAAKARPFTADLITRAQLASAAHVLVDDIRRAQRQARATGQRMSLTVDALSGTYVTASPEGMIGAHRLPPALSFGAPDAPESDGITFRDNTVWFAPRPGPQNSVGSISFRSRTGGARKVTVSLTGHTTVLVWDGNAWN